MARHYVIQDWSNSATWSGEMIGDRLSKSKGHHFLKNGMANTEMYAGDEEDDFKKKSRVPLKNRILPQSARVEKLRSEAIELEAAFKAGEFTPEEYTLLRDVQFKKLRRAEELLKKAIAPIKTEDEHEEVGVETAYSSSDVDCSHKEVAPSCGVSWMSDFIDELPRTNSFKKILQITCKTTKALVRYKIKISNYVDELKNV